MKFHLVLPGKGGRCSVVTASDLVQLLVLSAGGARNVSTPNKQTLLLVALNASVVSAKPGAEGRVQRGRVAAAGGAVASQQGELRPQLAPRCPAPGAKVLLAAAEGGGRWEQTPGSWGGRGAPGVNLCSEPAAEELLHQASGGVQDSVWEQRGR